MALEAKAAPPLRDVLSELTLGTPAAAVAVAGTSKTKRKGKTTATPAAQAEDAALASFSLCTGGAAVRVWTVANGSVRLNLNFASSSGSALGGGANSNSSGVQQVSALATCSISSTSAIDKPKKATRASSRRTTNTSAPATAEQLLAVGLESGGLQLWDTQRAQQKWATSAHTGRSFFPFQPYHSPPLPVTVTVELQLCLLR